MITPAFDLSQDPENLILRIRVPYTRTSEFDLYIDGTDLKFYAKPYFLRLTLPGRIVEDGRETAAFDIDEGIFTLKVPKETAGEHFEGLQMLTSLLAPKGSRSAKPLVEDVSAACSGSAGADEEEDEEFDWQLEQKVYAESSEAELGSLQTYGFGNQRSGVFARLQEELSDVIDIKDPEGASAAERRRARLQAETSAFSPDHYLADMFDDDEIQRLLKFSPWWAELSPASDQEGGAVVAFTNDEKDQLRKFPSRSYLLGKTSRDHVWLSLVDLLLAYSYEVRSTEGEHNVESAWTIRKLSGTLSWLETYSSLQEVLVSFGRRALCYPLYRHFAMVSAAVCDTSMILQSGKACVLKCLLDIHRVFRENDPAYILNDLYITDYCIWIQRVKSRKVTALANPIQKASLQKKELELELEELEEAATIVAEEEGERGASSSGPISTDSDSSSASSSSASSSSASSSDSSEESEESEAGGHGSTKSTQGGGAGGESANDNLLQAQPTHTASPLPQEQVQRKADSHSSASEGSSPLIQELEELLISQPQRTHCKPQTDHAHPVSTAGHTEVSASSSTDHHPVSTAGHTEVSASSSTDHHPVSTAGHTEVSASSSTDHHPVSTAGHTEVSASSSTDHHPVSTAGHTEVSASSSTDHHPVSTAGHTEVSASSSTDHHPVSTAGHTEVSASSSTDHHPVSTAGHTEVSASSSTDHHPVSTAGHTEVSASSSTDHHPVSTAGHTEVSASSSTDHHPVSTAGHTEVSASSSTDHHPVSTAGHTEVSASSSTDHHPVSTAGHTEVSASSSTDHHPVSTAGHTEVSASSSTDHHPVSTAGHTEVSASSSTDHHPVSTAPFLELTPGRNLLFVVQTEDDLD